MRADSVAGSLLLSVPQMLDPNFMHTVVLVCDHGPGGAFGFVVNQRTDASLAKLAPDHPVLGDIDFPIYKGGPVGKDALQFVHRRPEEIPGGQEVAGGLYLGGEIEALAAVLRDDARGPSAVRLLLGYSGWAPGQLDLELETGSWVPTPLDLETVFLDSDPEEAWRRCMRSIGDDGDEMSRLPPDVSWN